MKYKLPQIREVQLELRDFAYYFEGDFDEASLFAFTDAIDDEVDVEITGDTYVHAQVIQL